MIERFSRGFMFGGRYNQSIWLSNRLGELPANTDRGCPRRLRGHPDLHGYTSLLVAISGSVSPVVEMTIPPPPRSLVAVCGGFQIHQSKIKRRSFSGRPNCAQNLGFRGWGR
jgi:hypothetical protein